MLKFLLPAGNRWVPDLGISASNFSRKLPAAGNVNEFSDRAFPGRLASMRAAKSRPNP
jgi:hypothetical protein